MSKKSSTKQKRASDANASADLRASASSGEETEAAEAGAQLAAALEEGGLDAAVAAGHAAAAAGGDVRAAVAEALQVVVEAVAEHVQLEAEPRVTFDDVLAALHAGKSFTVVAVAPHAGHYVGHGIHVSPEPTTYPLEQLFALDRSFAEELLADRRVRTRIAE